MLVTRSKDVKILPSWDFKWDEKRKGYFFHTKKNTYKIFFDNIYFNKYNFDVDIWIGKLIKNKKDYFWVTCEKQINARSIIMFRGIYNFKQ